MRRSDGRWLLFWAVVSAGVFVTSVALGAVVPKMDDDPDELEEADISEPSASTEVFVDDGWGQTEDDLPEHHDEAIVQMQKLIDNSPNDPDLAEYKYALAELYLERAHHYTAESAEQDRECQRLEDRGNEDEARRCQFRVEDMERESERLAEESIVLHIEIIRDHPEFDHLDEVYYRLGRTLLMDQQQPGEAVEIFLRLASEFPSSERLPVALSFVGDHHFDNGDMKEALEAYRKAGTYPDSDVHQYALHRTAAAHFALDNYRDALSKLLDAFDAALDAEPETLNREMLTELRGHIVQVYVHVGSPDEAVSFCRDLTENREQLLRMTEQLAASYGNESDGNESEFADSTRVYRNLIELNDNSHRVIDYQYEIVRNAATIDTYSEDTLREMARMLQLVQAADDDGLFEEDGQVYRDAIRPRVRETSRKWAYTFHREADRTNNEDIYVMAHHLYRGYRETFPEADDIGELTFFHAELLFEIQQWEKSEELYRKVLEFDSEGEYASNAEKALAAIGERIEEAGEQAPREDDVALDEQARAATSAETTGIGDRVAVVEEETWKRQGPVVELPSIDAPVARTDQGKGDLAIVIAVEEYHNLPDVPGAELTGLDWKQTFFSGHLGMHDDRILFIRNAEAVPSVIEREVSDHLKKADEDSRLWFVFIGHGAPDPTERDPEGLLVGASALNHTAKDFRHGSLPQSELESMLARGVQDQTIMVLDACFSGQTENNVNLPGTQAVLPDPERLEFELDERDLVFSAADHNEATHTLPGETIRRPAFSYALLGALRGWADTTGDGTVTPREAQHYLRRAMVGMQTPSVSAGDDSVLGTPLVEQADEDDPGFSSALQSFISRTRTDE